MKTSILVIEDDHAIRNLITTALGAFGYKFKYAGNGREAIMEAVSSPPDLFILDLGLPDMDGTEIIKKFRTWTDTPIIVVSARSEINDKITALDAGADDYLTKPFSIEELLARIRVALRKTRSEDFVKGHIFINGGLCIDYASNCVWVDGSEVRLTPIEYRLLCLLAQNAGKVLTHNYILNKIWLSDFKSDTQSLRVFIATLRKKIEKNPSQPVYLQTHVGIGYRMIRILEDGDEQQEALRP